MSPSKLGSILGYNYKFFAQANGNEDPIKDFNVASKVTFGADHMHLDPMSICIESQNAFQCLFLDPIFDRYIIVAFVRCVA